MFFEALDVSYMELHQTIKEFQETSRELEKQQRRKTVLTILKLVLIGFFISRDIDDKISELTTKKDETIKRIKVQVCEELESIGKQFEKIKNSGTYLIHPVKEQYLESLNSFEEDLSFLDKSKVLEQEFVSSKKEELVRYRLKVLEYNREFIKQRKKDYSYLWNKGLLSLDEEQKVAIITDDKYNLVVAAAGSGKTEVLITRIAYLIARKPDRVQPERILAIAYQRKAKEEIEQRLRDRYDIRNINIRTFHKLGKDILEKAGREFRRRDIIDENKKHETIKGIFEQKIKSEPDFYKLFLQYAKTLHDKEAEEDFRTKEETLAYAHERPSFSIDNTCVSSRAEKEILDFFLTHKLNGKPIAIKYEPDVDKFRPDFYLPEYDLFIEHWALNEKGEVPKWFSQSTEEYKKSMEMKKKWFSEHDKMLVETFTHEYDEDNPDKFIESLKSHVIKKLQAQYKVDFEFAPKNYEEIVEVAWGPYKNPIDDIVNFITIAKTHGLTPTGIAEKLRSRSWTRKQFAFSNLAVRVHSVYEEELQKHGKIDFEDMINNAISDLTHDKSLYADVFDHILIDEYQDISAQRYKLIKKLLERNPKCKLFCVGDDWQSIMGFSGSNLNFFINFEQFFENPAVTRLSTNYRSTKSIVDGGADLIKNNGNCQIQKATMSNRKEVRAISVFSLTHRKEFERQYYRQTAEDCLNRIAEYLKKGYDAGEILVLSRYMRTRVGRGYKFLSIVETFLEKAKENGIKVACENADTQNSVRLLTVHKSKGLEAKVVFILNVIKDIYGFPCEIDDPSIYEPARENYPQQEQKEEERRLLLCSNDPR